MSQLSIQRSIGARPIAAIILQTIIIIALSYIATSLILPFYINHPGASHSLMELFCIIIAGTIFIIVLCRFDNYSPNNQIIGMGFLIIAIFDTLHTYYYASLGFAPKDYLDLSVRYWVISGLTEAALLMSITLNISKARINKWIGLLVSLVYSLGISYLIIFHNGIFPVLYNTNGVTDIKVALGYTIILILLITLWNIRNKINRIDTISYRYLSLTVLLFIPAELSFTLYKSFTDFQAVFGHVLKIAYYICLCKGILETEINYPYIKLEQANKRLNDILNAIPLGINTYNEELRIDFINRKFEELLHCKRDDVIGLTGEEFLKVLKKLDPIGEESLPVMLLRENNASKKIIGTYQTPDGEKVKLSVNAFKIEDGILILSDDIKREQEIDNLNIQTQTLLDATSSPIMILDKYGNIKNCNPAFEKLICMEHNDITGKDILKINEILQYSRKDTAREHINSQERVEAFEASIISRNGAEKDLLVNVAAIKNIDNEKVGFVVVMQDITEIKKNQEKLINQEKLALLGQMGASIVHETRNYLTTIKGNSQLIELFTCDERIKEYAKRINAGINELNRIISEFLSLSKPRSIELEEVSVYDLIDSIRNTIEASSLFRNISIDFNFNHDERYLLCDEVNIKQVILNLCKNAVEAMDGADNPRLIVETGIDETNNEVFIKVIDNGKGIPKDIIPKLGTPFFTTKENGNGLGLNSCFQIVKMHRGRIEVQSELDTGTTFSVILPSLCCKEDEELYKVQQLN